MAEVIYLEPRPIGTATTFEVSPTTVGELVRRNQNTGIPAPRPQAAGLPQVRSPDTHILEAEVIQSLPREFESNQDYARRVRQEWAQSDDRYLRDLEQIDRQYDETIRDIDNRYPRKTNRGGGLGGARRTAESLGAALSGFGEYQDSRARGNGLGESLGRGIGNGIGAAVGGNLGGTAAGTKAAAATGMNPVAIGGAAFAGGLAGGLAGGALGAEVGGAIGRALDNLADWLSPDPSDVSPLTEGDTIPIEDYPAPDGDYSAYGGILIKFGPSGATSPYLGFEFQGWDGSRRRYRWMLVSCNGNISFTWASTAGHLRLVGAGGCFAVPETHYPKGDPKRSPLIGDPRVGLPLPDLPTPISNPSPSPDQPRPEPESKPAPEQPADGFPIDIPRPSPFPKDDPFPDPAPLPQPQPSPSGGGGSGGGGGTEPDKGDCDPCVKLDEVLGLLKQEFVIQALLTPCEAEGGESETVNSRDYTTNIQGLQGLSASNQAILSTLVKVWDAVKCPPDTHGSIPESYIAKAPTIKPQLQIQFKESSGNSHSRWHITIPHFNQAFKDRLYFPEYEKGNVRCVLTLKDNSKIVVNAASKAEGQTIITACLSYVEPGYAVSITEMSSHEFPNRNIKRVRVKACFAQYFSGTLEAPPNWIRRIT